MSSKSNVKETPLMKQHSSIKVRYPDAILLFRVGDFYETFGQDAIDVSKILNITLTKRNNGIDGSTELAGFPYHALDTYLHKIIKAGRRVAICDQLENPQEAKGLVKRGVTEVVTPGVTSNDKILNAVENNYLASIHIATPQQIGIAFIDVSTAAFYVAEGDLAFVQKLLHSFSPSEVIVSKKQQTFLQENLGSSYYTYCLDDWMFEYNFNKESIIQHFEVHPSLKGFGIEEMHEATIAAGVILHYLKEIKYPSIGHIRNIQKIHRDSHLWMDAFTFRNLEIASGQSPLVSVIDATKSPMGARLLRQWIRMPLIQLSAIEKRLSLTAFFVEDESVHHTIANYLEEVGDVERMINKIPTRKVNPREVLHIGTGLLIFTKIKHLTSSASNDYLRFLSEGIHPFNELSQRIEKTILPNPPVQLGKGELVCEGVDTELDELKNFLKHNKEEILNIQQSAISSTGISGIKIGFNQVFGYYLEVSNTHKHKVPSSWTRRQTLTNAERYITEELKQYEEKILGAQDRIFAIEARIYEELLQAIEAYLSGIANNCVLMATIDCLQGFASIARENKYCKPTLTESGELRLTASRHPVIEQRLKFSSQSYVPNDVLLNTSDQQILLITGPNMSGKSALLRQVALNTLMAHIGSFVACTEATIPITDRIFTRVGASDNLAQGESTFMVEMNETASILNNISERSLILLDELGRGTATYDGISIAWSILEYLASHPAKPKTLFSTHYHELVNIEETFPNIKNFHVSNIQDQQKIVFLRTLQRGGSKHSFGIHVAKLAGIPWEIVRRADDILALLENEGDKKKMQKIAKPTPTSSGEAMQIHFKVDEKAQQIARLIESLDLDRMTPVEALLKLQELKQKL